MPIVAKYNLNGNAYAQVGSNGTPTNITWVAGKENGSARFNGSNSKIDTPTTVPNNNNVSFECMIFDESADNTSTRIITADSGGGYFIMQSNRIGAGGSNGVLRFNIYSGGDNELSELNAHQKNVWLHYVGVLTGGLMYLYRNGQLQSTRACGNIGNISNGLDFGANSNTGYFAGKIDNVIIYNHGLSDTEVKNKYLFYYGYF